MIHTVADLIAYLQTLNPTLPVIHWDEDKEKWVSLEPESLEIIDNGLIIG